MKLKTFFFVSQVLSFRLTKQTSKKVADTTFKVDQIDRKVTFAMITLYWEKTLPPFYFLSQ